MHQGPAEVIYQIDKDDLLVLFNNQWNAFATDNGSPHLLGEKVLKLPLWEFIHDAETRHLHETLLKKVRANKIAISKLPFRCDAPALRRFMEMDILPLADGSIEYRCRTLRTERREPIPLTAADEQGGEYFLRMCSWCKKVDVEKNTWLEIEQAVTLLGLMSAAKIPPISHTMCNACLEKMSDDNK